MPKTKKSKDENNEEFSDEDLKEAEAE